MDSTFIELLSGACSTPQHRFTIEEVAHLLGLTPDQVRNQIKRGHLRAVKVSARKWGYVLHDDLDAFIANLNGGVR